MSIRSEAANIHRIVLVVCAVACASVSLAGQRPPTAAAISATDRGIRMIRGAATVDVEPILPGVVRVHVMENGKSSPRTLVIDPHLPNSPTAGLAVERIGKDAVLRAPGVTVKIEDNEPGRLAFCKPDGEKVVTAFDPFDSAHSHGLTLSHVAGEDLYGMQGLDRRNSGQGILRNGGASIAAGIQGNGGAPFFFTSQYGVLVDSDGGSFETLDDVLEFKGSSRVDVEYFVMLGRPMEVMADFAMLTGRPPMPPKWTLGFLNSQWGSTEDELKQLTATYRQKHLPIDGFILDFDWKAWGEDNYGEWRWNSASEQGVPTTSKYPDGASGRFAAEMNGKGIKLAGILKPRILVTGANGSGEMMAAAYADQHGFWYPGEKPEADYVTHRSARNLDFNNPQERAWFWEHLKPAFDAGMAAWWNDEADYSSTTIFNNFQFLNMGRTLYEGQRKDSDTRAWSLNRSYYAGATRYGYAEWSGDITTGFETMAYQEARMISALDIGTSAWSMDTGGFFGHPTSENYARWVEFAAFVPIFRVHGDINEKRQPWIYGPVAEAAAAKAMRLRYSLLPYIYSYTRVATDTGVGVVRPLFWCFPDDPATKTLTTEWMFGDALLVSPVVATGASAQTVYLPEGQWYDYASGKSYQGSQTISYPVDPATWQDIPLFLRAGSILATQNPQDYVDQQPVKDVTLDVFPTATRASFAYYDDDGKTYAYERGVYFRQAIAATLQGDATKVALDASTGSFATALRFYTMRIHRRASSLVIDGRPVELTAVPNSGEYPERECWMSATDRFGPVTIVRVQSGKPRQVVLR